MTKNFPDHEITDCILKLKSYPEWKKAMDYRNTWVHDKPPIIEGLGIQYDRKSRISAGNGVRQIGSGGGAEPRYQIDELIKFAHKATEAGVEMLNSLVRILIARRIEMGESINFKTDKVPAILILADGPKQMP